MSNQIEVGKRVLFWAQEGDTQLTPGVVERLLDTDELELAIDGPKFVIASEKGTFVRPVRELKIGTQDWDPAAWMLHDAKTSTPVVFRSGCYICEDPEFAQMGLPLCRKCPECVRQNRGPGHIAADDTHCDECGYQDGPEDYESDAMRSGPGDSDG